VIAVLPEYEVRGIGSKLSLYLIPHRDRRHVHPSETSPMALSLFSV
jgi:ribosomal protein S18 acetylase RimI-like enzyme